MTTRELPRRGLRMKDFERWLQRRYCGEAGWRDDEYNCPIAWYLREQVGGRSTSVTELRYGMYTPGGWIYRRTPAWARSFVELVDIGVAESRGGASDSSIYVQEALDTLDLVRMGA